MQQFRWLPNSWQEARWFKVVTNKYFLATLFFAVWMLFLDVNSYLIHRDLNTQIDKLEKSINFYQGEIKRDKRQLEELTSEPEKLKKFARENYWMKEPGEEIYLIDIQKEEDE